MKTTLSIDNTNYLWTYLLLCLLMSGIGSLRADPGDKEVPSPSLGFTENKGQINPESDVRYYFKSNGVGFYLQSDGITYVWKRELGNEADEEEGKKFEKVILDLTFEGANPQLDICAFEPNSYLQHFYTAGHSGGLRDIQTFEKVVYEEIYPHIDLEFYFEATQLKYDFIVKPGGKVSDIRLRYDGQEDLSKEADGSLSIRHQLGKLQEGVPFTYQVQSEQIVPIHSQYQVKENLIQFQVADYDPESELIIDPTLLWATYYGGNPMENAYAVHTDKFGNVYMAGQTSGEADDFAELPPEYLGEGPYHPTSFFGATDAFLVKFDPTGVRLWAIYYGGNGNEKGLAVSTDDFDNVYLAGYTESNEWIAHNGHDGLYQEFGTHGENRHARDAFLVKFDENAELLWGTYYGGEDYLGAGTPRRTDEGRAVSIDMDGYVYMAGVTTSENYIAHNGHDDTFGGEADAFLVKFSPFGARVWATYFGGTGMEVANALTTDDAGEVYMAGYTRSYLLGHNGHDETYAGQTDGFMVKYADDGTRLWATYYGGAQHDEVHSLAYHSGHLYMGGITYSDSDIAHNGHDMTYNGDIDAFLVKFNFFGGRVWGTYYGGGNDDASHEEDDWWASDGMVSLKRSIGVSVSKNGDIYLAGTTKSGSGISTAGSHDPIYTGGWDGYLARFLPDGSRQWGTYYGGHENDRVYATTTDPWANVYICGATRSETQIAQNGHDDSYEANRDAFLAKFKPYKVAIPHDRPEDYKPPTYDPFGDEEELDLTLSPNPTSGQVRVIYAGNPEHGPYQIRIMDTRGEVVYMSQTLDGPVDESLNLSSLRRGLYHLSLLSPNQVLTENLQVE